MVNKNNAICSICGKPYYMCNVCKDFKSLYPYKLHTDTATHFQIYQVIHGYSTGVYNKEEAKEKLENIDLSDLDTLRENIKEIINDILETKEKISKNKQSVKSAKSKPVKVEYDV